MSEIDDKVNYKNDDGEDAVAEAIHALRHAFRTRHLQGFDSGALPLAPMEGRVLNFIARNPDATQSDVANHSRRDKGQVARLVLGLKERGLIAGTPDADDRRLQRLSLTDAGKAAQERLRQHRAGIARLAVQGISSQERQQLLELLERVRRNLAG